jgi:phosphoribosylformimino-5-aminoimidazole carboxamide ribonucleotide (ProFAR) isomerase
VILFPAIDLKEGRCVRLIQGDMDQATVFNEPSNSKRKVSNGFTLSILMVPSQANL